MADAASLAAATHHYAIPMAYTLAAAAAATGTNKTTVLRAIKAGKITGTKDAHGQ
jgi:hypothetical protein